MESKTHGEDLPVGLWRRHFLCLSILGIWPYDWRSIGKKDLNNGRDGVEQKDNDIVIRDLV